MTYIDDHTPFVDQPAYDPYEDRMRTQDTTDRAHIPHDRLAEQAVLGALLLDPARLPIIRGHLKPDHFWLPHHATVYQAITTLADTDQPIDMVTVAAHLDEHGDLKRIGGPTYLHDLEQACPITANAEHYADVVLRHAKRRAIQTTGTKLLDAVRRADPDDIDRLYDQAFADLDESYNQWADHTPGHTPTSWAPVDLDPVLAGEYLDPPPTMLQRADGVFLLYDAAVHTISGESESGKTWLTLLAALQLIADDQHVVFIDFEDRADRVIGRLLALGATPQQVRDNFAYVRPDRPLDDLGRQQLAPHLRGARLVILDGVTEAMTTHGYDLNSNADSALFQALLPRWIADHGPAVVMIDHVVKDKEKQDRFALGAQHKLAGIDGAAYIVKMLQPFGRGKRGIARIDVAKDRPGHVREHTHGRATIGEFILDASIDGLVLKADFMPPGHETGRAGDTFEPTVLMEKISRYVQANPGMSKKAIEGAMNGKATTIRLALELLVTRGYIGVKTGARGAVQHFHDHSYYADPDAEEATSQTRHDEAS